MISNLRLNRLTNYENGGIKYDSIFEQNLETNRKLYDVNLPLHKTESGNQDFT